MIQRIQTVYLVLAAFLLLLMFSNPLAQIILPDKNYLTLMNNRIFSPVDEAFKSFPTWPLSIFLGVIVCIEMVTIFLYKKRILQKRFCRFNLLMMFGLLALVWYYTRFALGTWHGTKSVFLWPVVCPMISIVLNYLAMRAIQKDEDLVRSYDRIR
jgi:hypothetical protein